MKKSTMMRLLTVPFWTRIVKTIWIIENNPESIATFTKGITVILAVAGCCIVIAAAFAAAKECDYQDEEILELRAKK